MIIISSALCHFGGEDMTVTAKTTPFPADLAGCVSYVGHPATRALLEALGATTDASGKDGAPGRWAGPQVGESYLAVPLAFNARPGGMTQDEAVSTVAQLRAVRCTRLA